MSDPRAALILGGAGFVGSNLARSLVERGHPVLVFDSLVGAGARQVVRRLRAEYGEMVEVQVGDLRDRTAIRRAVARAAAVFHVAGQVRSAANLVEPLLDFEVNLRATVDLLEELRRAERAIPLVYGSTTRVYGALHTLPLNELASRYELANPMAGIDEQWPLEVSSPYGCSRVAADQYVLEYARSFGLPALVARIGSTYGPEDLGSEDQGWVTHSVARAIERRPITIQGDGKQVRDLLHIDDLVDALARLMDRVEDLRGHAFNVGGGQAQAVSVRELLEYVSGLVGEPVTVAYCDWRAGEPRYFVSDTSKLEATTGWRASIGVADGVSALHAWLVEERRVIATTAMAHAPMSGALTG